MARHNRSRKKKKKRRGGTRNTGRLRAWAGKIGRMALSLMVLASLTILGFTAYRYFQRTTGLNIGEIKIMGCLNATESELLNLARYQEVVAKGADTALKINISWHFFYPASSTTPWQLDGVIAAMLRDGFDPALIHGCHNRTVVIDAHLGERENKQLPVIQAHGLRNVHLYEGEEWIPVRDAVGDLADRFLCLNDVYPNGFHIPRRFLGENVIHLPTVKTHVFTTTTGAMKNAFGGLLNTRRHYTHSVIHETLVDLLMIQQEIHAGIFATMDGTHCGSGPGPRTMIPVEKDIILASADCVAIDAIAAKIMGFNPLDLPYIRLAHERGLGCGNPKDIEVLGEDISGWNFNFPVGDNLASTAGDVFWFGPLKRLQHLMFHTPLVYLFVWASYFYHDYFWYPFKGQKYVNKFLESKWGKLFGKYE